MPSINFPNNPNNYPEWTGEYRNYEATQRGMVFNLGQNPQNPEETLKIKFPGRAIKQQDGSKLPLIGRIRIRDGEKLLEEGFEAVRLLEKSGAFLKGRIRYVPNPDECRAKALKEAQDKSLAEYKALISEGVFTLNFEMPIEGAVQLASQIGVPIVNGSGKPHTAYKVLADVAAALGLEKKPKKVSAPQVQKGLGKHRTQPITDKE